MSTRTLRGDPAGAFSIVLMLALAAGLLFVVARTLPTLSRTFRGNATFRMSEGHTVQGHYDVHWSRWWGPSLTGSLEVAGDPPMRFRFDGHADESSLDDGSRSSIRVTSLDPRHRGFRAVVEVVETRSRMWISSPGSGRTSHETRQLVTVATAYTFWIGLERIEPDNATSVLGSDSRSF